LTNDEGECPMKMKRLLSAILTLAIVLSLVAVPVTAEDTVPCAKTEGCTLAEGHEGECAVPTEPETTYCDNAACLMHKQQPHDPCVYCTSEGCVLVGETHTDCLYCINTECTIRTEAHTECKLPEEPATCGCADKCNIDSVNPDCDVCAAAAADTLDSICKGTEPVYENCEVEGCDLVKGHEGEHTGMGNFVQCDGSATPDSCEATEHNPGCYLFAVKDTNTLKAALDANMTEITLADGFVITETIVIPAGKEILLDMADKNVAVGANVNPAIRVLGKLTVKNGKMNTADGVDADGYCFIVGGTVNEEQVAGELVIESGTYHGAASAVSVTKGTAAIKGGTFSAEPADGMEESLYVLNCIDANYQANTASIVVTGGTFVGFNPADNQAEGENTNFIAQGYCVKENDGAFVAAQHILINVPANGETCQTSGNLEHWKCNHCGKLYDAAENGKEITEESTVIPAAAHDLEAQAATTGTCTEKGTIAHWKCTVCGDLYDAAENGNELTADDISGDFGPHDLEKQDEIPATCKEEGTKEHWKCADCGTLFDKEENGVEVTAAQLVLPKDDHDLEKQAAVVGTCQTNGTIEHWKCSVCDKLFDAAAEGKELTEEDIIGDKGPHDLKYQGGKAATYDADGIAPHYYCEISGCGEKFEDVNGTKKFEGSTVIPMLSYVEDGVLVIDEDAIANENKKNVVLDLLQKDVMGSLTEVTQVQFQTECLEEHVDRGGTLWIYLSDAQVYFDNDALETIVEKAQGSTVTLLADEIAKTDSGLTAKQKTTLNGKKDPYIIRLQMISGSKRITADFGGKVYVYLTEFEPKTGYKNSNYSAFFLDEDGTTDTVSYYSRDARITVEHFSEYFLSRNVKAASSPQTGDTSNVMVWAGIGLAAVAALVVLVMLNRKKKVE